MKILCNSSTPGSKLVNQIGKKLYRKYKGSRYSQSGNMVDIDVYMVYAHPEPYAEVEDIKLNINITTYSNKIRINVIELDPQERTICTLIYDIDTLKDIDLTIDKIYKSIYNKISKLYSEYDFII